jgi:hypothetical protein
LIFSSLEAGEKICWGKKKNANEQRWIIRKGEVWVIEDWGLEFGFLLKIGDLGFKIGNLYFCLGLSVRFSLDHEHLSLFFLTGETMPGVEPMGVSGQEHSHTAP